MCRPKTGVGFLCRFDLKTGIDFALFGQELGMVFEETTGVYERICRFEMDFKKSCLSSSLNSTHTRCENGCEK